jgi:hypothetical protein
MRAIIASVAGVRNTDPGCRQVVAGDVFESRVARSGKPLPSSTPQPPEADERPGQEDEERPDKGPLPLIPGTSPRRHPCDDHPDHESDEDDLHQDGRVPGHGESDAFPVPAVGSSPGSLPRATRPQYNHEGKNDWRRNEDPHRDPNEADQFLNPPFESEGRGSVARSCGILCSNRTDTARTE